MKIFTKIINNCEECPNRVDDEEEHEDYCIVNFSHTDYNKIPNHCPLENFKEGKT